MFQFHLIKNVFKNSAMFKKDFKSTINTCNIDQEKPEYREHSFWIHRKWFIYLFNSVWFNESLVIIINSLLCYKYEVSDSNTVCFVEKRYLNRMSIERNTDKKMMQSKGAILNFLRPLKRFYIICSIVILVSIFIINHVIHISSDHQNSVKRKYNSEKYR